MTAAVSVPAVSVLAVRALDALVQAFFQLARFEALFWHLENWL
jgi:hypothetical protein